MLTTDHTILPATNMFNSQVEWAIPAFTSQPWSITALYPVLISHPTEGRRLSWPGWLLTYRDVVSDIAVFVLKRDVKLQLTHSHTEMTYPQKVTRSHPPQY